MATLQSNKAENFMLKRSIMQAEAHTNTYAPLEDHNAQDIVGYAVDVSKNSVTTAEYDIDFEVSLDKEVDIVDVNAYLDAVLSSELEKLQFKWSNKCQFCNHTLDTYQQLLAHSELHKSHSEDFSCILANCDAMASNTQLLARHFILQHNGFQHIQIYGTCPYCELRFSDFAQFNKHSCYRKLRRKAGARTFCRSCKEEFSSFKRFVFHLQFHLLKRRPKFCLICEQAFSSVNAFFEHVHYSHEPEDTLACKSCDRTFWNATTLLAHMKSHKLEAKYNCTDCTKSYAHKQLLVKHRSACHRDGDKQLKCDLCTKEFNNETALLRHMKWHEPEADVHVFFCGNCGQIACEEKILEHHISHNAKCLDANIEQEIMTAAYTCEFCALDFKEKTHLKMHRDMGRHTNGIYECSQCKATFTEFKLLRIHEKSHSTYKARLSAFPLKRLYLCNLPHCNKACEDWSALYRHKNYAHKHYKISNNNDLQNLNCQESELLKFTCQFCAKECPTKMSLSVHISRRHNKSLVCSTCGGAYKTKTALQTHIEQMHVPITCSECDKVFKNQRNLKAHKRVVHENEQRYYCNICQKGYYYRSEKEAHERNVHTDIVYRCEECEFTTNYAQSLDIHLARHKNEFQYKCPICAKGFGRKRVLTRHIRTHQTDSNSFVCSAHIVDGCSASFDCNQKLNEHIIVKHAKPKGKLKPNNAAASKQKTILTHHSKQPDENIVDVTIAEYADFISNNSCDSTTVMFLEEHMDNECFIEYDPEFESLEENTPG